jgi:hypothetical protein
MPDFDDNWGEAQPALSAPSDAFGDGDWQGANDFEFG